MKKYTFTVKKILKNTVEIKSESRKEAVEELIELLAISNGFVFKDIPKEDRLYEIKLDSISEAKENYTEKEMIEEILQDIATNDKNFEEDFEEKTDEIEDDILNEYDEIICDKCGNCIQLD